MSKLLCIKNFVYIFLLLASDLYCVDNINNLISVNKNGVLYNFNYMNSPMDSFCKYTFANWEPETFEVFEKVKDDEGIAIDLGAWIGTTSIWMSKNFKHVLAVEGDRISLNYLDLNLKSSDCYNVNICSNPVCDITKSMYYGPTNSLNDSGSHLKEVSDSSYDYIIKTITFKQLLHDYIYTKADLKDTKISFIKCDIEGGEENILEDILYFAHHNKVKVWLSFHLDWWKYKKIEDFDYLFKLFTISNPDKELDPITYLKKNPFGSLLFEPKETYEKVLKKNIPAVIIGYNQYTYITKMVKQLEKYTKDIIIIDNNSSFEPLLDYYKNDFKYTLLKQPINYGHRVASELNFIEKLTGKVFLLTDPDLRFNEYLPDNFIQTLFDISNKHNSYKVGFALKFDTENMRYECVSKSSPFEKLYWINKIVDNNYYYIDMYEGSIDTTFALYNSYNVDRNDNHIRIASNFTCMHLPWYKDYLKEWIPGELDAYLKNNISTSSVLN